LYATRGALAFIDKYTQLSDLNSNNQQPRTSFQLMHQNVLREIALEKKEDADAAAAMLANGECETGLCDLKTSRQHVVEK
jgi:hypothetical protein